MSHTVGGLGMKAIAYGADLHFMMNEASGSVMASVNGATAGAYTGVTLADAVGPDKTLCPYFDGVNDYAGIKAALDAVSFDPATKFTVGVWVKVVDAAFWTDGDYHTFLHIGANAATNFLVLRKPLNNGRLQWYYEGGNVAVSRSVDGNSDTDWFHLMMTVDVAGDVLRAYKNGVQQGADVTGLPTWAGALAASLCCLGASSTTPGNPHDGWLAHATILVGAALTPAQVALLYAKEAMVMNG